MKPVVNETSTQMQSHGSEDDLYWTPATLLLHEEGKVSWLQMGSGEGVGEPAGRRCWKPWCSDG